MALNWSTNSGGMRVVATSWSPGGKGEGFRGRGPCLKGWGLYLIDALEERGSCLNVELEGWGSCLNVELEGRGSCLNVELEG